jgi:hypothetical protein
MSEIENLEFIHGKSVNSFVRSERKEGRRATRYFTFKRRSVSNSQSGI